MFVTNFYVKASTTAASTQSMLLRSMNMRYTIQDGQIDAIEL